MFDQLSEKILQSFKNLNGQGKITEKNIEDAIKEIRMTLLDADVNFKVVKSFINKVKEKSLGEEVFKGINASQLFIKIVEDELTVILGSETVDINLRGQPAIIFLVGLQGAGKTTTAAKLALHIRKTFKKKPGLISLDVYRPAAIEQLKILGEQNDIPVFSSDPKSNPKKILKQSKSWVESERVEVLIVDTAGRTQLDDDLMSELEGLKKIASPHEILLVADAMLGQQSVNVAEGFHSRLGLTGLILTKVDGDARGGAALSIRETTGVPIKFLGVGEKVSQIEVFHPDRLASRILDKGDVVSFVEKAKEVIDEKEARVSAQRISKNQFTVDDFFKQIKMMNKMGGFSSIMKMMPGMGALSKKMKNMAPPDKEIKKIEAIIQSMTIKERHNYKILNGSRRLRIAKGSGTEVSDVNKFIRRFEQSRKMMSQMMKMGLGKGGGLPF